jgi:hypothetical protein
VLRWSASDFAGTPAAVAEVGHSLWGKASALVPQQYRDLMVPNLTTHNFMDAFYGLASQNVGTTDNAQQTSDNIQRTTSNHKMDSSCIQM